MTFKLGPHGVDCTCPSVETVKYAVDGLFESLEYIDENSTFHNLKDATEFAALSAVAEGMPYRIFHPCTGEMFASLATEWFIDNYSDPPRKLSELLVATIADARRIDRDIYWPHAGQWHSYNEIMNRCEICLGGARMAGLIPEGSTVDVDVEDFSPLWESAFDALDLTRTGRYSDAIGQLERAHRQDEDYVLDTKFIHALDEIPPPVLLDFSNWEEFDKHLESIEKILLPKLQELGL